MAITEESRHQLYTRLDDVLGPQEANTLMEHLPPVGWADVTTKQDLDHLHLRIAGDIDGLRHSTARQFAAAAVERRELRAEIAAIRNDMARRTDTESELTSVRADMAAEFAAVRNDMAAEFAAVRNDMAVEFAAVRNDTAGEFAAVRHEMATGFAALKYEIENQGNLLRLEFQKGLMRHTFALVGMGAAVLGVFEVVERLL